MDYTIVTITGKAEENGNSIKLIVDEISLLLKNRETAAENRTLTITIDSSIFDAAKIYEIKSVLSTKDGDTGVFINLKNGSKQSIMELENVKIHYDKYTEKVLGEIFGKDNIILQ
jgi:DNA polymerase III alpha subunit